MIEQVIEFSPMLLDTPNMAVVISVMTVGAFALWAMVAHDIYLGETMPKLWEK
ncbi:hypothetical protein [Ferrimonas lipolytica]|uniref:Uncharacterized protein n=1 Tax=Ferrimonas lipolytica TaxID=2724191 RepID=A0A6H1UBB3_9GAMM|nr:hypothetical protein [Ferrimonas lipolytica]QIZ76128.1 hypothetical protein HER31_04005 [Ferrimonas lipolytica]